MNEDELALLEERLRAILVAADLGWLMPEVDATIAAGVTLQKEVDEYGDATLYEVDAERPTTRRRPRRRQVRVTYRPLTRRERVQVLVDAIRRVGVDGPRMEQAALSHLREIAEHTHAPRVRIVDFVPDEEDTTERPIRIGGGRRRERNTAASQLERLLDDLMGEADG